LDRRTTLRPGDTVAVLGGGLAGLSAARTLAGRGIRPVVLERDGVVGGLAATCRCGGFHFDYGPHRFHTTSPEILATVRDLVGSDLLELDRLSRIRLLDRYFVYPLDLADVLRRMPLHKGAAMICSYMGARLSGLLGRGRDDSFESWVVGRFGRRLYDVYFGPYTGKLWGIPPADLSPDWASQRISVPGLGRLLKETVFPGNRKVRSLVSRFHYPRGGIGRIAEVMAADIEAGGGTIVLSARPDAIERIGEGWIVTAGDRRIEAAAIVNTVPVTEYARLMRAHLGDGAVRSAQSLTFRSIVFVTLRLSERPAARDHWIYTPEPAYRFNRLSIPENFDPGVSRSGGQVTFEFTCDEGDDIWRGAEDLEKECADGGARLGLFSRDGVLGAAVTRQTHAYPVYRRGYEGPVRELLENLDSVTGSVTCGRQGLFRYNNMDHSIEMGLYAALELFGEGSVRERFDWSARTWADG
jgi:protoporphyrinogen oxidase